MSKQLLKNIGITILAGAVLLVVKGQDFLKGIWADGGNAAISVQSSRSSADQALSDKLQPFIVCINRVDSKLRQSIPGYRGYFPELVKNPNGHPDKGGYFFGFKIEVYERDNQFSKECISGLRTAIAQPPADAELDASGKIYADALEKLVPLMNAADTYYQQGDYKDDNFKEGKKLDAKLSPLFDQLLAASDQMRNKVQTHNLALRERELEAVEKSSGKGFEWHTLNVMLQARRGIDDLDAMAQSGKLSTQNVKSVEERLVAALDEGKKYSAAHPDEKTAKGNKPYWFELERTGSNLITSVKELRRNLSSNANQNDIANAFGKVGNSFNSLVKDYNMAARFR